MATHSSTLAWKIPWTEKPGRLQSVGSLRVRHDFTFTFHFHALEKEMATHSSVLAWRIPGMGHPGGLPSMGSHWVGHNWSDSAAAGVKLGYLFDFSLVSWCKLVLLWTFPLAPLLLNPISFGLLFSFSFVLMHIFISFLTSPLICLLAILSNS